MASLICANRATGVFHLRRVYLDCIDITALIQGRRAKSNRPEWVRTLHRAEVGRCSTFIRIKAETRNLFGGDNDELRSCACFALPDGRTVLRSDLHASLCRLASRNNLSNDYSRRNGHVTDDRFQGTSQGLDQSNAVWLET